MASENGTQGTAHLEGASYAVAFGDPSRPFSEQLGPQFPASLFALPAFPDAGGLNPYEPERGQLESVSDELTDGSGDAEETADRAGCAFLVVLYDLLRELNERSRGLEIFDLMRAAVAADPSRTIADIIAMLGDNFLDAILKWVVRGCLHDRTLVAFHETPDFNVLQEGQIELVGIHLNLSARERGRLRVLRRMPYVLTRQLVLKKVTKRRLRGAQRQVLQLLSLPDELFRVVIKFL